MLLVRWIAIACCALSLSCARPAPPRKPPPPPEVAEQPVDSGPVADTPSCVDGKVVPEGSAYTFGSLHGSTSMPHKGGARELAIVLGACAATGKIRACLAAAKERAPMVSGSARFALTIEPDGKVSSLRPTASDKDAELTKCIGDALAAATYPAGASGEAGYHLMWGDSKIVKMRETGTDIYVIDPAVAKRALRANFPKLRACYEQALKRRPGVRGWLSFDMILRPKGTVESLHVDFSPSFDDGDLLMCAANVVKAIEFGEIAGGRSTIVYPLAFETVETHE